MARHRLWLPSLSLVALLQGSPSPAMTKVFHDGHIHVLDAKKSVAEWLAVEDGEVVAYGLGTHHRAYHAAHRVNLKGRWLLPALVDSERLAGNAEPFYVAGSLAVGRRADFVLLEHDPLAKGARPLSAKTIVAAFVGGEQRWPQPVNPQHVEGHKTQGKAE